METQQSKSLYLGKLHTVGLNPTIKRALVLIIHPLFIPLTLSSPPAPTSALSLAAAVKVSALNKGVNNVFFKSVWDLKLLETWITAYQIFGAILWHFFKTSPHLTQLFGKTLHHCFAVKLQKCLMDCETSPDSPSAPGLEDCKIFFLCVL